MRTTIISLVTLVLSCAPSETPEDPSTVAVDSGANLPQGTYDQTLADVAKRVSGFGGMFSDSDGNLNVYLLDIPANTSAIEAREAEIREALVGVLRRQPIPKEPTPSREPGGPASAALGDIILLKGQYDFPRLMAWLAQLDDLLTIPGVVLTDLDERRNRLRVGVETAVVGMQVEQAVGRLRIPKDAVIIEVTSPIVFQATLRDRSRPISGGMQTEMRKYLIPGGICTFGFNAVRSGTDGFVTCSHCTITRGTVDGTDFYQPEITYLGFFYWLFRVGDELKDPPFITGGACPAGRQCRFSDSAFVDYWAVSRGWGISKTSGRGNRSLVIDSSSPRLRIAGEVSTFVDGAELDKIGRTTGWTVGTVDATCANMNVSNTNITMLCNFRVGRRPGDTGMMSDRGDSGSPVFVFLGPTVLLAGILWGGPVDGSSFVFSSMNQIEAELGALTTIDPSSSTSNTTPEVRQCPSGHECCESTPQYGCIMCVPSGVSCP